MSVIRCGGSIPQTDRDGDFGDEYNVTHWMPLPSPPTEPAEEV